MVLQLALRRETSNESSDLVLAPHPRLMIHTNLFQRLMMMLTLPLSLILEVRVDGLMLVCGFGSVLDPLDLHTLIKKCGGVGQNQSNRRLLLNTFLRSALAPTSLLALQPRDRHQMTSSVVHPQPR